MRKPLSSPRDPIPSIKSVKMMLPALSSAYTRLTLQKTDMLAEVGQWPDARLRYRKEPAAWSMLNVIDHLVKVESGIVAQFESTLAAAQPIRLRDRLGTGFMYLVMRSPMRVKVPPAASDALPQGAPELDTLSESWTTTRTQMERVLEGVQPDRMHCGAFRHPVTGWMDLTQTLDFLSNHLHHHSYQMNRIKTASQAVS